MEEEVEERFLVEEEEVVMDQLNLVVEEEEDWMVGVVDFIAISVIQLLIFQILLIIPKLINL